ncbi:MAG TPA: hypothetical protein VE093_15470 [Polyangiaceae bacterium]|jgi:acetylornithine/succinyldiaminopimelate/putrescine aminotransferase|nr:hypothetical protein [Polyangiaceae bacterium]
MDPFEAYGKHVNPALGRFLELTGEPFEAVLNPHVEVPLVERLFRRRILAQVCGHAWSVVRVEPPLTVSDEACARFVEAFANAIRWLEENAGEAAQ